MSVARFLPLLGRARPQHAELVAVRVGHDHPADLALARNGSGQQTNSRPADVLLYR